MGTRTKTNDVADSVIKMRDNANIRQLTELYHSMLSYGWKRPEYAPKDGNMFECISLGSTGIHKAYWLECGFWIPEDGDMWPLSPALWRPIKKETR